MAMFSIYDFINKNLLLCDYLPNANSYGVYKT